MIKTTNLNKVREVAVLFLLLPISETELSPVVVQHPIFESGFYSTIVNGEFKVVNLLEDEESLKGATDKIRNKIEHADNIYDVYAVIRAHIG